jgi:nucleolar complex protein 2
MGKKVAKSARKFAASGQLKRTIQARHKHQEVKKKIERKKGKGKQGQNARERDDQGPQEKDGYVKEKGGK